MYISRNLLKYFKLLRNKYFILLFIIFLLIDLGFSTAVFSFYFISPVFLFPYTTFSQQVDQSMEIWCRSRQPLPSGILRTEYKKVQFFQPQSATRVWITKNSSWHSITVLVDKVMYWKQQSIQSIWFIK